MHQLGRSVFLKIGVLSILKELVIGMASLREDTITELRTLKRGWLIQELKMVPDLALVHFGNSKAKKGGFTGKSPI